MNLRTTGTARDGVGADEKVIIERLCISLPYVETFNSKVIKGCVPELRNRYVFFVFKDSYALCYIYMYISHISSGYVTIGQVGRVFANGPGDLGSFPGRVLPKTSKMVLDTSLLNTQQ